MEYTDSYKVCDWREVEGKVYDWGYARWVTREQAKKLRQRRVDEIESAQATIEEIDFLLAYKTFDEDSTGNPEIDITRADKQRSVGPTAKVCQSQREEQEPKGFSPGNKSKPGEGPQHHTMRMIHEEVQDTEKDCDHFWPVGSRECRKCGYLMPEDKFVEIPDMKPRHPPEP